MKLSTQTGTYGICIIILMDEKHFWFSAETIICQIDFSYSFVIPDAVENSTLWWLLLYKIQALKKYTL